MVADQVPSSRALVSALALVSSSTTWTVKPGLAVPRKAIVPVLKRLPSRGATILGDAGRTSTSRPSDGGESWPAASVATALYVWWPSETSSSVTVHVPSAALVPATCSAPSRIATCAPRSAVPLSTTVEPPAAAAASICGAAGAFVSTVTATASESSEIEYPSEAAAAKRYLPSSGTDSVTDQVPSALVVVWAAASAASACTSTTSSGAAVPRNVISRESTTAPSRGDR